MVELLRESSAPLPARVQQAFQQHEKSAKIMLLPAIKCACAAIDLQLFVWRYDRLELPLLGYIASAALLIKPCLQPPAASITPLLTQDLSQASSVVEVLHTRQDWQGTGHTSTYP